jgi:Tfp pilus assembly protein PilF
MKTKSIWKNQRLEVNVRSLTLLIAMLLLATACSVPTLRTEMQFANQLAEEGLWEEARYRWEKQLEKNPDSPALLNNLAVAMEQLGKREQAEKLYRKAMALAPNNAMIQRNFNRFSNPDTNETEDRDEKPQLSSRDTGTGR